MIRRSTPSLPRSLIIAGPPVLVRLLPVSEAPRRAVRRYQGGPLVPRAGGASRCVSRGMRFAVPLLIPRRVSFTGNDATRTEVSSGNGGTDGAELRRSRGRGFSGARGLLGVLVRAMPDVRADLRACIPEAR